jgi:hypothetical protein
MKLQILRDSFLAVVLWRRASLRSIWVVFIGV